MENLDCNFIDGEAGVAGETTGSNGVKVTRIGF